MASVWAYRACNAESHIPACKCLAMQLQTMLLHRTMTHRQVWG